MGMKAEVAEWVESHSRQRIYIDGYRAGKIFRLREDIYGILTCAPHRGADTWVYLIIGTDLALAIDTGFGIGNLKSVLTGLAGDRPLMVANSHYHADHSLGNVQFDTVYIGEKDAPILQDFMYPEHWNEFCDGIADHSFYEDEDIAPFHPYRIVPLANQSVIRLGEGHEVEAVWMPGHSPGEMCFLDHRNRVLFSGDAFMDPFPTTLTAPFKPAHNKEFATVTAFYHELQKFAPRTGEFDCLMDGHGRPGSSVQRVSDMLECADRVIREPDRDYTITTNRRGSFKTKSCGMAAISYRDERI
ncbi:MAG: MBL fold metallo-hydrolase [Lachnospiraceae bacterium]|nr:MBL fold metallo-hydrolase [Lachnospiraceae bacterium]